MEPRADYSCYITLRNTLTVNLTLVGKGCTHGEWKEFPPDKIQATSISDEFRLKDKFGVYGSDGWVEYRAELPEAANEALPVVTISFCCPTGSNNNNLSASATIEGSTEPCHLFKLIPDWYPKRGHPLQGALTIEFNDGLTTTAGLSYIQCPAPAVCIRNTQDEIHFERDLVIWERDFSSAYEDNSNERVPGSFYPVAVNVANTSPTACALDIYIDIDDMLVGVPFGLSGHHGSDTVIHSTSPLYFTRAGRRKVPVQVCPPWQGPQEPWGVVGDIIWKMTVTVTAQVCVIGATRLEFYAINAQLPKLFQNVVPVTLAREFVARRGTTATWLSECCKKIFIDFGFQFDSLYGASAFGLGPLGGPFRLASYLASIETRSRVNAYDQTAMLQTCLGLGREEEAARWVHMVHFGFLQPTILVGRPRVCNNPFFENPKYTHVPNCEINDMQRSWFPGHTFVSLGDKILDACIGPHGGDESLAKYVNSSIDRDTQLYPITDAVQGKVEDATFPPGVTRLGSSSAGSVATQRLDRTVERLLRMARTGNPPKPNCWNADFDTFFQSLDTWQVHRCELYISETSSTGNWVLGCESGSGQVVTVQCTVTAGHDEAAGALADLLAGYAAPNNEHVLRAPPEARQKGQFSLESAADCPRKMMVWVYGNVLARITQESLQEQQGCTDIQELAEQLYQHLVWSHVAKDADVDVPVPPVLTGPSRVKVGETFTVYASSTGYYKVAVICDNGNAVFKRVDKNDNQAFFFHAAEAGKEVIRACIAHPCSLSTASSVFKLEVVPGYKDKEGQRAEEPTVSES